MELQFHNENVHIMTAAQEFIAIVDDNLLNEKRVNEMARHITCTLSMVGSQWQGNMSHTHTHTHTAMGNPKLVQYKPMCQAGMNTLPVSAEY